MQRHFKGTDSRTPFHARARLRKLVGRLSTITNLGQMRSSSMPFGSPGAQPNFALFNFSGDNSRPLTHDAEGSNSEGQFRAPIPAILRPGESRLNASRSSSNLRFEGRSRPTGASIRNTCFESPTITLLAGPHRRRIWAHKDLLTTIPFFRAALDSSFVESQTNTIELPEDDTDAVRCLVSYLYSGDYFPRIIRSSHGIRTLEPLPRNEGHSRSLHIQVHVLAEKYDVVALRDLSFRKIFLIDPVDVDFIEFLRDVYTFTQPNSKLRYGNRMEEYWALGLHERIKEMRRTCPEELDAFLLECPEFMKDLIACLSLAVDCALGAAGLDMEGSHSGLELRLGGDASESGRRIGGVGARTS